MAILHLAWKRSVAATLYCWIDPVDRVAFRKNIQMSFLPRYTHPGRSVWLDSVENCFQLFQRQQWIVILVWLVYAGLLDHQCKKQCWGTHSGKIDVERGQVPWWDIQPARYTCSEIARKTRGRIATVSMVCPVQVLILVEGGNILGSN